MQPLTLPSSFPSFYVKVTRILAVSICYNYKFHPITYSDYDKPSLYITILILDEVTTSLVIFLKFTYATKQVQYFFILQCISSS